MGYLDITVGGIRPESGSGVFRFLITVMVPSRLSLSKHARCHILSTHGQL